MDLLRAALWVDEDDKAVVVLLVPRDNKHGRSDIGVRVLALLSPAAAFVAATAALEAIAAEFAATAARAASFLTATADDDNDDNDQE